MLKKFTLWFICFGLSFLIESFGWTQQGKAFLLIDLGANGLVLAILILVYLLEDDDLGERIGISINTIIIYVVSIAIPLFATWVATKLFKVDYYVVFQTMTFGQCLCSSNIKND